eukprot:15461635-Alexandrium_andersonii.AAC.1
MSCPAMSPGRGCATWPPTAVAPQILARPARASSRSGPCWRPTPPPAEAMTFSFPWEVGGSPTGRRNARSAPR